MSPIVHLSNYRQLPHSKNERSRKFMCFSQSLRIVDILTSCILYPGPFFSLSEVSDLIELDLSHSGGRSKDCSADG